MNRVRGTGDPTSGAPSEPRPRCGRPGATGRNPRTAVLVPAQPRLAFDAGSPLTELLPNLRASEPLSCLIVKERRGLVPAQRANYAKSLHTRSRLPNMGLPRCVVICVVPAEQTGLFATRCDGKWVFLEWPQEGVWTPPRAFVTHADRR